MTLEQATAVTTLRVLLDGDWYPAEEVARGAAYELFAHASGAGFLPNPRPGARYPYRRFVHATDVLAVSGSGQRHAGRSAVRAGEPGAGLAGRAPDEPAPRRRVAHR